LSGGPIHNRPAFFVSAVVCNRFFFRFVKEHSEPFLPARGWTMKPTKLLFFAMVVAPLNSIAAAQGDARPAQQVPADDSSLVGDWRGKSVCVVRDSACRDEDSLYHLTKMVAKPGWFSMKLDKIVDGKPVTMGTTECSYDAAKRALTCEFPRGIFHFTIQANKMTGTMNLTDGTLWRRITLTKPPAP
jgi:hypothetical protein